MIQEASVYALKKISPAELASYGTRVLTMRRWPRGLSWRDVDLWLPSAGPSDELLAAWNAHLLPWHEFVAHYRIEQQQQIAYLVKTRESQHSEVHKGRSIDYLSSISSQGIVTVSCWEQHTRCHRFELVSLVDQQRAFHTQEGDNKICDNQLPRSANEGQKPKINGEEQVRYRAIVWAPSDNQKSTPRTRQETLYDGPDVAELRRVCSHYHTLEVPQRRGFYDIRLYKGRRRIYQYDLPKA